MRIADKMRNITKMCSCHYDSLASSPKPIVHIASSSSVDSKLRLGFGIAVLSVVLPVLLLVFSTGRAGAASRLRCANYAYPGSRAYLSDCRAYELVTPPYKEAIPVFGDGPLSQDGSRLIARSLGSFAGVDSMAGFSAVYTLSRTAAGWLTTPLEAPRIATYPRFAEDATSSDLTRSLWLPDFPDQAAENIFRREEDGASLVVGPGGPSGAIEPRLEFIGASSDLSHLVFTDGAPTSVSSEVRLWPGDATRGEGQQSLYEYAGTNNSEPMLVGVNNKGVVAGIGESALISQCGTEFGNPGGDVYNAISQSGSAVFFTALGRDAKRTCRELPPETVPAVSELYARINNGLSDAHTVAISEPIPSDCSVGVCQTLNPADARFQGASLDGSQVFFTTAQRLLVGTPGEGPDLYEYNFRAPEGRKVTLVSTGDTAGAQVQGVARVSEDGSHVYFVARGVMTGEETNAYGDRAHEGAENLYVSIQECSGGGTSCPEPQQRLAFIGRLSEADKQDWAESDFRPSEATPDGRFFVFQSAADLTPDDTSTASQIFEYDAQAKTLVRISHGVGGYNDDGNTSTYPATISAPSYREVDRPESSFTTVSADGAYVFFMSSDSLSPYALVGHPGVYEYHDGEVSLISDGHDLSRTGSTLLGTDRSGYDVFFTSGDPLVPQDTDTQEDVYDARIDGGFAAPTTNSGCSGDVCQGPLASVLQPPTSTTLSSEGENTVVAISGGPTKSRLPASRKQANKKRKHRKARARKARRAAR
jgi:hypothetical protein